MTSGDISEIKSFHSVVRELFIHFRIDMIFLRVDVRGRGRGVEAYHFIVDLRGD